MSEKAVSPFWRRPASKLGWWSFGLALGFLGFILLIVLVNALRTWLHVWSNFGMISFGFVVMLLGLAAGITAFIAILKKHERSWLVWLSLLPGIFTLFLLVGELAFPE